MPRIAFVGAGNMARSLIAGLLRAGHTNLVASDPDAGCRAAAGALGTVLLTDDNRAAVHGADAVVLAVKPQVLRAVATDIAADIPPGAVVVSIAAGIPLRALQRWLVPGTAIVRTMPNTPALIGRGITALYADPDLPAEARALAQQVLDAAGESLWVPQEADLDAVTALSGSGPAYAFLLIEAMAEAGARLGLAPDVADRLALATVAGAAELAVREQVPAAELRRRVSSPGGTTLAALAVLEAGGLRSLFDQALAAAAQRSRELADAAGTP